MRLAKCMRISLGRRAIIRVTGYRVDNLFLQIAQIVALSGNAAVRAIPPRNQRSRLLIALNLECDIFHRQEHPSQMSACTPVERVENAFTVPV
jgi:hypothetical protein